MYENGGCMPVREPALRQSSPGVGIKRSVQCVWCRIYFAGQSGIRSCHSTLLTHSLRCPFLSPLCFPLPKLLVLISFLLVYNLVLFFPRLFPSICTLLSYSFLSWLFSSLLPFMYSLLFPPSYPSVFIPSTTADSFLPLFSSLPSFPFPFFTNTYVLSFFLLHIVAFPRLLLRSLPFSFSFLPCLFPSLFSYIWTFSTVSFYSPPPSFSLLLLNLSLLTNEKQNKTKKKKVSWFAGWCRNRTGTGITA